jgi:hypothetical protein
VGHVIVKSLLMGRRFLCFTAYFSIKVPIFAVFLKDKRFWITNSPKRGEYKKRRNDYEKDY